MLALDNVCSSRALQKDLRKLVPEELSRPWTAAKVRSLANWLMSFFLQIKPRVPPPLATPPLNPCLFFFFRSLTEQREQMASADDLRAGLVERVCAKDDLNFVRFVL